ncbi:MarR family winged helix-turn-helix transcriptional regulator [Nonomuraea soli]|uniref:DNA-binding MarR family transcriptional regulator n=1 Tax=Nonomuraea soli TaxID=1032476 RepID=A0A7W0HWJ0_9ACTN|nr:MarR family transcriptional regulator [Nonomuraea soli]MBA2897896.1 DNA-binding MarR family transcriptional regulator [Nonomuraea soli]
MTAARPLRPSPGDAHDVAQLAAIMDEPAGVLATVWAAHHLNSPVPTTQLRVLFLVEREREVNVSRVAEELDALLSSASRLCGRLESTDLLERVPASNRREIRLRLTQQGQQLLDGLREVRRRALADVLAVMDPADRDTLLTGLAAFAQTVRHRGSAAEDRSMLA